MNTEAPGELSTKQQWFSWLKVVALVYLLLIAVNVISDGFKLATATGAEQLFELASNPIIALIIGVVATSLMQSSSTVTSIIVGMVAGGLPIGIAIPMAMGANIGTSLTSTLVSLGNIRDDNAFGRAFSAATVHDSFNVLAVFLILPIEIVFRPLERLSGLMVSQMPMDASVDVGSFNVVSIIVSPFRSLASSGVNSLPDIAGGIVLIIVGIAAILFVVTAIGRILKKLMVGTALRVMETAVGRGPISGIGAGTVMTVMVQSSTTTTSLIVPMAGAGIFNIRQVYPFTLGANIGTTITALLAATSVSGPAAAVAMQIALVHLLFNIFAILLIFGLPVLRNLPIFMAEGLSVLARRNKLYVAAYIGGVFFVAPLIALGCTQIF